MTPEPYDADIDAPERAVGFVVDEDRGSLPYHLVHGEALVAAAAWAMGEAGVDLVDVTVPWSIVADQGRPLVLHDPLCPMTPPEFIAECVRVAAVRDVVVAAVRPVTDTVKEVADGQLGRTVDRDGLVALVSPVVLPAKVVAALPGLPATDFVELVTSLRASYDVELVEAPPAARRVASDADLRVLEALTQPS
ncbi:2-C-methyl-D-erythritol 4-phosphate cytidylyltransferase [Nocardioides antri]|uniref:2-C-methyl-D-erythritol 4-phosphate cytidylyltransferase n=1 Tax=Nocardioides antri TaxID=2607659 RepID=A0A5B1M3R4_9ACTN|nr:2-C-methyl-D-erythritol 4-phosphate cytidylyltransferase [Nocardioides antri]KAA1427414.1 2-C-methyl-D-erythritol 4-phosphate cytidylyltransferase [Nocardioides antri]